MWPDWIDEIHDFIDYLDKTWFGRLSMTRKKGRQDPLFKFSLWNKWNEIISNLATTNNSNEAYNNQWNQTTEKNPSYMWTIINNFIREESLARKTLQVVQTLQMTHGR